MKLPAIVENLKAVELKGKSLHLAIGVFDGLHLGHLAIIESTIQSARQRGAVSGVLTFYPHPSRILNPHRPTLLLMSEQDKVKKIRELGIDLVIQKLFTSDFAAIKANEFIPYLKKYLPELQAIYVGENFRFGQGRSGKASLLLHEAEKHNLEVFIQAPLKLNGLAISSTHIRKNLIDGQIAAANKMLGYTYFSYGQIESGLKIGRKMGFPTINVSWTPELQPRYGVYAVKVHSDNAVAGFNGVANYGVRPTFSLDNDPKLEVHMFESSDLKSGDKVTVEWYSFIRPEVKFNTEGDLKKQIVIDKAEAKNFFSILDSGRG